LITIYAGLADISRDQACAEFGGRQFSEFKTKLADLAVDRLTPIADEMRRLLADPGAIDRALQIGAEKARDLSAPVLKEVYDIVGLLRA
jgi:tryptophanyl-tRNA synthetase